MNHEALEKGYKLAEKFVYLLNLKDFSKLNAYFGVTIDIYEEIIETISNFYDILPNLSILTYDKALSCFQDDTSRYDFFEYDDSTAWGLDCKLLADGKIDDPIIHFRVIKESKAYNLEYLYIDC